MDFQTVGGLISACLTDTEAAHESFRNGNIEEAMKHLNDAMASLQFAIDGLEELN